VEGKRISFPQNIFPFMGSMDPKFWPTVDTPGHQILHPYI